jgi:hypothetical protein
MDTWMNLESQEHYFATQRLAKIELSPMIKGILGNTQKDRQRSRLLCMVIYERITLRTDGEGEAACWHPKQLKGSRGKGIRDRLYIVVSASYPKLSNTAMDRTLHKEFDTKRIPQQCML